MFRKEPLIKPSSNLKGSERKKLLQTCRVQTGVQDYMFPSNTIKQAKYTAQYSAGIVYLAEDNVPIWFKEKHSELLIPTVYTSWMNPRLLPVVLTHDAVIEERIFNGANLMLAGTVPPFDPRCVKQSLCGIVSREAPEKVTAIGEVRLDLPSYESVIGKTGVAVEIFHFLTDGLSQALNVKIDPDGFVKDETEGCSHELPEKKETRSVEDSKTSSGISLDNIAEVLDELRVEDVDNFFKRSLYYTLTNDEKLELPISASNFISNHILKNLPTVDQNHVNMRRTSWKKTAKFLKHFEKENFLKLKGKGDDLTIVGVNKAKEDLKGFTPYRVGKNHSTSSRTTDKNSGVSCMLYSETFYKPKNLAKSFISEVNISPKELYDAKELQNAVNEYIVAKNLVDQKNKRMVLLDDLLFDMIKSKKTQKNDPRIVSRAEIMAPLLENNFQTFFQLFRSENEPLFKRPVKGPLTQIRITTEMKMGRKVVTKVSNFDFFQIDPEDLAGDLKRICSGSTTIGETATSPKTAEVQVQGAHVKVITEYLNKRGIPSKWIDVNDKVKKNKSKKH
ncbi:hypothetical protein HG535_0G04370 [Zygotorulaspora mrakii]|uniref:Uncharacterized protein n=1 Tax=Zygotorulaspora mrakii TaxID=42260 RepID=A0A7H9B8H8_ZYGMR|nr:uncharacterized protein HG535_0G04370 [Zygotorulaspora mrakii]QLG74554.1 hypothetical protein HG535_0G04370 [Zygotorulaspora mrakii]